MMSWPVTLLSCLILQKRMVNQLPTVTFATNPLFVCVHVGDHNPQGFQMNLAAYSCHW